MKQTVESWAGKTIKPGERKRIILEIGRSFSGSNVNLPIMVWRSKEPGPVLGISAAVHGDEINGTGAIRSLIQDCPFELKRGSLIFVPVVNIMGFERHSRYMPDRRDLNRCFPGSAGGSLSARLAKIIMSDVIERCDYLVDLHTAAVRRTNFPNVRADCSNEDCERLARAFGCEMIVNSSGPQGSLRAAAVNAGCPTIILEAGEVWKVEPAVLDLTRRGVMNVMIELGMIDGELEVPPHQVTLEETRWVRSGIGGFLHFHVAPGEPVVRGQIVASSTSLLGKENEIIRSPNDGIIMGMTTMPAVGPGDPIFNIATPINKKQQQKMEASINDLTEGTIETDIRTQLATNITVTDWEEEK